MHAVRHLTVSIACPVAEAYAFLADPRNLGQWASGLGTLREEGGAWLAATPGGTVRIRFAPRNDYGVLDHWVTLPTGATVYVPMRVVANAAGCELALTLFRQPTMDDAQFAADAEWVQRDLAAAKRVLEGRG